MIAIVDADLLGRKKHRFPNLACEKIAGYWRDQGEEVRLIRSFDEIAYCDTFGTVNLIPCEERFAKIYISKVFTDTPVPMWVEKMAQFPQSSDSIIQIGGTGFYFDKALPLPEEIEHHMPDYHLYDGWIAEEKEKAKRLAEATGKEFTEKRFMLQFKEYTDYSIGFLTRGCFRKCPFCINQKYEAVSVHSPLDEFFDESRKKICLLDDNFLGCGLKWKELLKQLIATGRQFKFKQGLDERLLKDEMCELIFSSKYDGDITFAFDKIEDYEKIEEKLKLIQKFQPKKLVKFYVLVGFSKPGKEDIVDAFKRIELLMKYKCLPYIMRYQSKEEAPWKQSEWAGMYVSIARWCNQPNIFKKMSFRQFCQANQELHKSKETMCSSMLAMKKFESLASKEEQRYLDMCFSKQELSV